jgi:hypothetical protein
MLKIQTKQHIKFATVDKGTAVFVVAILVETHGNETISISEPKIVKIIQKSYLAITGQIKKAAQAFLALPAQENLITKKSRSVVSPYINSFGYSNSIIIPNISAQPPTF